jgi:FKBP-type peptidyl-prolyl cis-trans isomerase
MGSAKIFLICSLAFFPLLFSCGPKKQEKPVVVNMDDMKDPLININKKMGKEEKEAIDAYVQRNHLDMIETGTGVRYMVYEEGKGIAAESNDVVLLDFEIKLLDGTLCYSSKETGAEEFTVDYDNVESGMHEAIKYLHEGDRAIVIIPSHRAFGLAGDDDKIPPMSTVVYNLHLLKVIPYKKEEKKPSGK